jgi:hypothetical protein
MNTRVERIVSRRYYRVFGLTYLSGLAAWARLKYEAYCRYRLEIEAREALRAMSPELLDDIGVKIDASGKPVQPFASHNPHLIATEALTLASRYHDPG